MKAFTAYWAAGCVLVGMAMAQEQQRCGAVQLPDAQKVIATVATWPVILGWWVVNGYRQGECDGPWGMMR